VKDRLIAALKRLTGITRSKAWRLHSSEYAPGDVNICFIGSEIQKNFLKRALFPESGDEQYLGVRLFHRLSPLFLSQRFDLTIAEKLSEEQLPAIGGLHWELPFWVHTYADIPPVKLNNSFRSDLRLIRKNRLAFRVTTDPGQIRDFFERMYLPLVRQRHGDSSIEMHLDELEDTVEAGMGELLLVLHDDRPIAGMVLDYRGSLPNLWSVGVLDASRELMVMGAIPACYHFCYEHLRQSGYSRASLGLCRAFVDDGVLTFKRKFGLKLLNATGRSFVLIPNGTSRPLAGLLSGNAFIHSTRGKLGIAAFVDADGDAEAVATSLQKRFSDLELASCQVYSVTDAGIRKAVDAAFDRFSVLARRQVTEPGVADDDRAEAARYLVRHLLNVRSERSMLLYGDEQSDPDALNSIDSAASAFGMRVDRLQLDPGCGQAEQSRQIETALQSRDYDVLCEASGQYFYNTPSWRLAHSKRIRTFGLGPLDCASLVDCVGRVDHHKVFFLAERIAQQIRNCGYLHIADRNGTELSVRFRRPLSNQILSRLRISQPRYSVVHQPTGFLSSAVNATFLGGQLSFLGYLPGTNGKLVIDGFLWPPKELGPLQEPVVLEIRHGTISRISGGSEARLFAERQPASERQLEHICIGLNPGASLHKSLMEAERAFGACNFGFGVYLNDSRGNECFRCLVR